MYKWLHDFSCVIYWHKESCLYYLGEAVYEKQTYFVTLGRNPYETKSLPKVR